MKEEKEGERRGGKSRRSKKVDKEREGEGRKEEKER